MALQIAEGAVVGDDLEPVAQRLEAAAGPVPAVGALAHQVGDSSSWRSGSLRPCTVRRISCSEAEDDSNSSADSSSSSSPCTDEQLDRRPEPLVARLSLVQAQPPRPPLAGLGAALEVVDPLAAAVGPGHAGHEARDHGLDLLQHHRAVAPGLGQRVGQQVQDQLLVALAAGVDAHVRERAGRQQAAQQVERLGLERARVGGLGLVVAARELARRPGDDLGQGGGVGSEQLVHRRGVGGAELGVAVVAIAAGRIGHRRVVGDVAGRLLQVGGQPRALEDLGQDVGDPLAGHVSAAELGHRVVAVAEEDPLVELGRALALDRVRAGRQAAGRSSANSSSSSRRSVPG